MTLLKTSTLKKITVFVLALALVSWMVVGIYRFKTNLTGPPSSTEPKILLEKIDSLDAVAGAFKGWQKLEGSQDRYLFLGETVFSSSQQGMINSRIRAVFEPGSPTLLVADRNGQDETVGYLENLTLKQVENLIKPGDFIKVFFKKKSGGAENLKDGEGNFLAEKILLQ